MLLIRGISIDCLFSESDLRSLFGEEAAELLEGSYSAFNALTFVPDFPVSSLTLRSVLFIVSLMLAKLAVRFKLNRDIFETWLWVDEFDSEVLFCPVNLALLLAKRLLFLGISTCWPSCPNLDCVVLILLGITSDFETFLLINGVVGSGFSLCRSFCWTCISCGLVKVPETPGVLKFP